VSSPTTIAYLPTALGASKATLLLSNNPSSGPYAWQLPQCTISSNPYGGVTGTYGLLNCIAIQNGAISAVVWFYEPPGGQGVLLSLQQAQYPNIPNGVVPWLYVGTNGYLYAGDYAGGSRQISMPISPGWHIAVVEEWAASTSGPYYFVLYLDDNYIGQISMSALPYLFGFYTTASYDDIGTGYDTWPAGNGGWFFFNGAIALVALYNRVLTTGDVLAIYQGNLVSSGLVAVWYGDDYNPSNGYWVSRIGGYTDAPITSSYPPRGCILWNSTWYSGPVGIWSNWQQC
jgi:hypothetical protein